MKLNKTDNKVIELLFISSILIFFNLGFVSISFPIGIYALIRFKGYLSSSFWTKNICWLTLLFLTGSISCIISPVPVTDKTLYFIIQFAYWLCLARMVGEFYPYLNTQQISKCIGWSCVILGVAYLFLGQSSQNSVAFLLVILGPIGLYGFQGKRKIIYGLTILLMMLFNDSRSGLAILVAEISFITTIHISRKRIKKLLIVLSLCIVVFISSSTLRTMTGNAIEPYNKEMALLLKNPEIVQSRDKSWIQRRIQVQKGIQIFKEYPIIGVGANNFTPYTIDIDYSVLRRQIDSNVLDIVSRSSDNRSTHNTYITLLSEFGALGFLWWLLFIGSTIIILYRNIKYLNDFEFGLFICAIGMSVYFYTIAALYGTAAWLFYGLLYGSYRKFKFRKQS